MNISLKISEKTYCVLMFINMKIQQHIYMLVDTACGSIHVLVQICSYHICQLS